MPISPQQIGAWEGCAIGVTFGPCRVVFRGQAIGGMAPALRDAWAVRLTCRIPNHHSYPQARGHGVAEDAVPLPNDPETNAGTAGEARLGRLLATLGAATRGIAQARDRDGLAVAVTDLLVANGAFTMAWIGADLNEDGWVEVIASTGDSGGYLRGIRVAALDVPEGQGPTGQALRSGLPFLSADIARDARMEPWRAACLAHGFRSSGAFPLHSEHVPTAVLNVYAPVAGAFGALEASVLEDLARAVGFAFDDFAVRAAGAATAARLRDAEVRYRSLVSELDAIVFVRNLKTNEAVCSPQAQAILGYDPAALADPALWRRLVLDEDRERVVAAWDSADEAQTELQYRMRHADGRIVWITERRRGVLDPDGALLYEYAVVADVTGRRQLEEAVTRTERLETVSRIAATAAHDFGNVLMAISLFQGFIEEGLGPDHQHAADVAAIGEAVERGRSVHAQLVSAGRDTPAGAAGPLDVLEVMDRLHGTLQAIAAPAMLRLEADAGNSGELPQAHIGRRALEHAVLNLVINARDAMTSRAGVITVTVAATSVAADPDQLLTAGRYVTVTVADTGPGMAREVLEHVFEPFYTTKEHGTGLGLPSVLRSMREAGGTVWIESAPGAGTTVTLLLPESEAE